MVYEPEISLTDAILELLKEVWDWIKKIVVKVISFFKNVVAFFQDPQRMRKIQQNRNAVAVAIKERLKNGDYNVVNCLYDKKTEDLIDYENDALVICGEDLDAETKHQFGNKDMVIFN